MFVGVDIGGTFTDLVLSHEGRLHIHKLLSTPANPALAMLAGLQAITPGGLTALEQVAHGSTMATNAILERKGGKIALITTAGFRDLLYIGRQNRPHLYALHPQISPPVVPRERCYEVQERLDHRGEILEPLDIDDLERVLDAIAADQVDAIAICLLYSFINPEHEERIRERILERGLCEEWQIALSTDILPEFREYERASTTALEAYVRPVMVRYVQQLREQLPQQTSLRIMKSDGGMMSTDRIRQQAAQTALSGPAAGVIGARYLASLAGYDKIITLDMGGTSTDVALCPGTVQMTQATQLDGLPLRARMLDIETIGAGGGSIARLDAGGALRVGPESAGASPGPIIYGQGGTQITVSDANALLGRLDPDHFLGGTMPLHLDAARAAFEQLAAASGMSQLDAAKGVVDVANVHIDRALRRVSIARGHDPRDFTLMAFGGAGALHACEVADRLEIQRVLVPRHPGVLCAFGLLVADVKVSHSLPVLVRANRSMIARLRAMQAEILAMGRDDLRQENIPDEQMTFEVLLDLRYAGQAYELTLPFDSDVIARFHQMHEALYGYALPERPVEVVNMRLEALGHINKPVLEPEPNAGPDPAAAYLGEKPSPLGGSIALYQREQLNPGAQFVGEALVFQLDSTVYIPAGWGAQVDGYRNLMLERSH